MSFVNYKAKAIFRDTKISLQNEYFTERKKCWVKVLIFCSQEIPSCGCESSYILFCIVCERSLIISGYDFERFSVLIIKMYPTCSRISEMCLIK